jgi:hypothetical protein
MQLLISWSTVEIHNQLGKIHCGNYFLDR